jgi:hypothetical protein
VKLRSWSYSTHSRIQSCPARVKYAKIDGLEDPSGPQAQRGLAVHSAFEAYIRGQSAALPGAYRRWQPALDRIVEMADDVLPELEVALDAKWRKTTWDAAVIRGKLDLVYVAGDDLAYVDYKTGGIWPEHAAQLSLGAAYLFWLYPWTTSVRAEDWYLDSEDAHVEGKTWLANEMAALVKEWKAKAKKDLSRRRWPAVRNRFCKSCAFNGRRGGPCMEGA